MRIIPAIDIINGQCVRLTKGDYATKKVYNENPLEVAKEFEANGIEYLHLVDLDGAKKQTIVNHEILASIASQTKLKVDFGGGLKKEKDFDIAFECGAHQVTGGSIAVKNPTLFEYCIEKYGRNRVILGADAKEEKIAVSGWLENTDLALIPYIKSYQNKGIQYVICTDIDKDGMLNGPAFEWYKSILSECPNIHLIASGGIRSIEDLEMLKMIGMEGAIIGKAIYEGQIILSELRDWIT